MAIRKINKALLDPSWEWGTFTMGDVKVPYVILMHPDHGEITVLLAKDTLEKLKEWLSHM